MGSSVQDFHLTMNSYSVVLGALLVVAQVKGDCQSPGNAMCYDATAGAVTGSCCSGSQCQPYIPSGTTPTGAVDWYCQYLTKLALGESCANKVGTCETGLNCVSGVCSDQPTTTTAATTTASCSSPGNALCYNATAGALVSSCCSGSQCQPYIPSGTTPTGAVDWYCQYLTKLALGESCANKVGSCDTNLNCVDGLCSDQPTTTTTVSSDTTTASSDTTTAISDTTTVSSDTTTASSDTTTASSDATTTASSDTTTASETTSTTVAETTTAATDCAAGGDICQYISQYTNITKDCCSPYACTSATSASSICTGDNLPEGTTCFTNTTGSLGTCASGLSCVTTTCVADDPTC